MFIAYNAIVSLPNGQFATAYVTTLLGLADVIRTVTPLMPDGANILEVFVVEEDVDYREPVLHMPVQDAPMTPDNGVECDAERLAVAADWLAADLPYGGGDYEPNPYEGTYSEC